MRTSTEIVRLIKALRISKKMSVEELANRVGIAKSTQSRYENEQRDFPINDIGLYANALDSSIEYLLGIGEKINSETSHATENITPGEEKVLAKYRKLDLKGKHTVNTVLDMEYKRCTTSNNNHELRAAHIDDTSEEQMELLKQDLDEL